MPTFDLIQCTVRMNQNEAKAVSEIVRAGPDALTPPEMIVLQMQHGISEDESGHAIRNAIKVGEIDLDREAMLDRIHRNTGADKKSVSAMMPSMQLTPKTLDQMDLPPECLGKKRETLTLGGLKGNLDEAGIEMTIPDMMKALKQAGADIPSGKLSRDDLVALMTENDLSVVEGAL